MSLVRIRPSRIASAAALVAAVGLFCAGSALSASTAGKLPHPRSLTAVRMAQLEFRAERYGILARRLIAHRNAQFQRTHRVVRVGDAPDPGALAAIRDVTIRMASLNGVASPSGGLVFSSSHKLAQMVLSGDTVTDDGPVFSVVVRGDLVGYMAHTATGALPSGSVMTITFDANTLEVTDWSLLRTMPSLTLLGISTALRP